MIPRLLPGRRPPVVATSGAAPPLETRALEVRLGGRAVLRGVDLVLEGGSVHALVGPNGAGKSTLLAALAGDLRPEAGAVLIEGRPAPSWSHADLARCRAVLMQRVDVAFPFTVTEVVRMGRAPYLGRAEAVFDDDVVAGAMATTEVAHLADRTFTSLSGGERARVALGRVLAQRARILLLDEPTAALDLRHQEQVFAIARQRAAAGDTVVVVMHDLAAASHADHVVVLHDGRVRAQGPPDTVLTADLLGAVYECEVEVIRHPRTGAPVVLPRRADFPPSRGEPT